MGTVFPRVHTGASDSQPLGAVTPTSPLIGSPQEDGLHSYY
jgi:hypothetical protein